jgi:GT2 family glycosyltransferase
MSIRISFVVPVRNDAVRLETCLRSILAGACGAAVLDIVVVDNGSTDGSPDVARRLGAEVLVIENVRVSELRNRGARHAAGDILAFVDADNEIAPGWVAAAVEMLQQPGVGAVGALYHAPSGGTWVQRTYGALRGRTEGQRDTSWLGSGNLAVWRRTFEAVGGFDISLEACEDVDLCRRIRGTGARIVGDARLVSAHHGDPRTLRDLFVSELWRGRGNLRVSFRRPIVWAELPSALIPVVDAAMLAVAAVGLAALAVAWPSGLLPVGVALLVIAAGALLKAARAAARGTDAVGISLAQVFVVACVYDVARAFAVVWRAPHRNARPRTAAAAS